MGTRVRATFVVIAIAALTLSSLTACSPEPDKPGTVRVTEGQPATLAVDGVTVEIPGESIEGSGTLSVTEGERDGHSGWEVSLADGAVLVGTATLTFEGRPQEGEPLPIVMYADDEGSFHPAETVEAAETGAKVTTEHFSFWMVTWWSTLVEPVKAAWSALFSDLASDVALSCPDPAGLKAAGYFTNGPDSTDERATWCAGMGTDGRPELQIKNERSYPAVVEATTAVVIQDPDESIESLVAQLFTILGNGPTVPGNSLYPLFSHDSARYKVTNDTLQALKISANPSAYVAQILRFAADTGVLLASATGTSLTSKVITKAFSAGNCVEGFGKMAGANPSTVDAFVEYLEVAIDASFECLGDTMEALYSGGNIGVLMVSGMSWIVNGAKLVSSAAQAFGDLVSNVGNDYIVSISTINRWLITSAGVGPAQFVDSLETIEAALGSASLQCRGGENGPWFVTVWEQGTEPVPVMFVLTSFVYSGEDISDAPVTQSGVTLGTPESALVALGYTKNASRITPAHFDYTWEEDGVSFVAGVKDGVVYGIGVGVDQMPTEYCG